MIFDESLYPPFGPGTKDFPTSDMIRSARKKKLQLIMLYAAVIGIIIYSVYKFQAYHIVSSYVLIVLIVEYLEDKWGLSQNSQ